MPVFEHGEVKIEVDEGTAGAPLPPGPNEIRESFQSWLLSVECQRRGEE